MDLLSDGLRDVPLPLEGRRVMYRGLASLPGQKMRAWDSTESGFPAGLSEVLPTIQPDVSL